MEVAQPKKPLTVTFTCEGRAVGKMRNDLSVAMTEPMVERFAMATDEGPFHGAAAGAFHRVVSQSYRRAEGSSASGHTYPASAANCAKPDCADWLNWPFRNICATSIPARVVEAEFTDLKVRIGRVSFLMKR